MAKKIGKYQTTGVLKKRSDLQYLQYTYYGY
jgi:hypothetical protein